MRAGVAIDSWKLSIFEKHLTEAGYTYETRPGVTSDSLMLHVVVDNSSLHDLHKAVLAANTEAALTPPKA